MSPDLKGKAVSNYVPELDFDANTVTVDPEGSEVQVASDRNSLLQIAKTKRTVITAAIVFILVVVVIVSSVLVTNAEDADTSGNAVGLDTTTGGIGPGSNSITPTCQPAPTMAPSIATSQPTVPLSENITSSPTLAPSVGNITSSPTLAPSVVNVTSSPTTPSPKASPFRQPTTSAPSVRPTSKCQDSRGALWETGMCGVMASQVPFPWTNSTIDIASSVAQQKARGCSSILLNAGFGYYMTEAEFESNAASVGVYADMALAEGIKTIVYYPSLEILTKIPAEETTNIAGWGQSAAQQMPGWIQYGLNGQSNVFIGDFVESAWFDPEAEGYVDYFTGRVKRLAQTSIAGLWADAPLYHDETGASWAGGSVHSASAFKEWSNERGLCPMTAGCALPPAPLANNFSQPEFAYWLKWRHHSLTKFLDRVRSEAQSIKANFHLFVENHHNDNMDSTIVGLDLSYLAPATRSSMSTVWDITSLSEVNAMKYASVEEMANQLSMLKYLRGIDKDSPSFASVRGIEAVDTAHVLAGAFALGIYPIDTRSPDMTASVDVATRDQWLEWLDENSCAVLEAPRRADVAVLYSSDSRDYFDHIDMKFSDCIYLNTVDPVTSTDPTFWSNQWWSSSIRQCFHIGQYRGAQYILQRLHVPYKVVVDTALATADLEGIKVLWVPGAQVMSDAVAEIIKTWVQDGGTLLSTGQVIPGAKDEFGMARSSDGTALRDLFQRTDLDEFTQQFGAGVSVLRKNWDTRNAFIGQGGSLYEQETIIDALERIIRVHVPETFILVNGAQDIHVEQSNPENDQQYLYLLNNNGMRGDTSATVSPQYVEFHFRAPPGKVIVSASVSSPSSIGVASQGALELTEVGNMGWIRAVVQVEHFSLVTFKFGPAPAASVFASRTLWSNSELEAAAELATDFILNKMRDPQASQPFNLGVFTNYIDATEETPLYAYGHHVTSEHMGLFLLSMSCLGRRSAWEEGKRYVKEIMVSPLYKLINWAVDKTSQAPFTSEDEGTWFSSTSNLDDFRTILGLLEGGAQWADAEATAIGEAALNSILWTSVSSQYRLQDDLWGTMYPGGVVGISWDWAEVEDSTRTPPAVSTGWGNVWFGHIAVNYQDIKMLGEAAHRNPRFLPVIASSLQLMLDAEIPGQSGLFYNNLGFSYAEPTVEFWSGDWEYWNEQPGNFLKTIQELWTGIHLANAAKLPDAFLESAKRTEALQAAQRCYARFKAYYLANAYIIPEYLDYSGVAVPPCVDNGEPEPIPQCLIQPDDNSPVGEPRIYALLVRLGHLLGSEDPDFLSQILIDKILPDRVISNADPRYGMIGLSALGDRPLDSDAWNSLEPILTMCMVQTNFQ